jgi:hypothetical protein
VTGPTSSGGPTPPRPSSPKIGVIVGAAAAGAIVLAVTIIICFYCWRRRRRQLRQRASLAPWQTSSTLSNRRDNRGSLTQSEIGLFSFTS